MLVRQHAHLHTQWELLKWMILLTLACILALGVLTSVAGASDTGRIHPEATPTTSDQGPARLERGTSTVGDQPFESPSPFADLALQVWQALQRQQEQKFDEAIAAWQGVELPCETTVWKAVALGQAYLATGEIDAAADVLGEAQDLSPDNPVVHYMLGLLRLEQGFVAEPWHDTSADSQTRFVALQPMDVAPNTGSMYRLSATMELEKAIRLAPHLLADLPLVPADWPTRAALVPTVGDLLLAVGADNYVAKAHNLLSYLYLERGLLGIAEGHMDSAARGGLHVIGYMDLGEKYAEAGQHTDAARAFVKAIEHSPHKLGPARKAWHQLREAWWELW